MKTKIAILLAVLAIGVFLAGCSDNTQTSGLEGYNQPQGQQNQYVGGGCGVAPADAEMPGNAFDSTAPSA